MRLPWFMADYPAVALHNHLTGECPCRASQAQHVTTVEFEDIVRLDCAGGKQSTRCSTAITLKRQLGAVVSHWVLSVHVWRQVVAANI